MLSTEGEYVLGRMKFTKDEVADAILSALLKADDPALKPQELGSAVSEHLNKRNPEYGRLEKVPGTSLRVAINLLKAKAKILHFPFKRNLAYYAHPDRKEEAERWLLLLKGIKPEDLAQRSTNTLKHLEQIALGLRYLRDLKGRFALRGMDKDDMDKAKAGEQYEKCTLHHLETGYKPVHNLLTEKEKAEERIGEMEKALKERVKAKLRDSDELSGHEIELDKITEVVYKDLESTLKGREPFYLNHLEIVDGKVQATRSYPMGEEQIFVPLKRFIQGEIEEEANRDERGKIIELEETYPELNRDWEEKSTLLVARLDGGMRLLGECDICRESD